VTAAGTVSRREFAGGLAALALGVRLPAQGISARIVSTAPSSTEALFALGLGRNVVGVSIYCEYPPQVKALPKVGTYIKPDVEAIARLRPDLVALQRHEGSIAGRLQALGIRYVELPYGSLADVYAGIDLLAQAAGVPQRGETLNAQIRGKLAAIQARSDGKPKVRALVIADRRAGTLADMVAVGPGNYVNEVMRIAGADNVLDQPRLPMYPHISLETVLRANPEVIVDLTDSHDLDAAHADARAQDRALWNAHPELAAVKAGRVSLGVSVVLLVPGPRTPEAAEMFYGYVHGARA
jgi:iron complex transport system substrate-binding protein